MTKDEALKLALETLEYAGPSWIDARQPAITAIKEALAAPQKRPQNCGTGYCSCIECIMKPLPRAWLIEFENGDEELHFDEQSVGEIHTPLYTTPTAQEMHNAAANLALMREMWGDPNQPAAKVNDEGFIVETGLLLSPGTMLYTTPPQRTWVGLTDEEISDIAINNPPMVHEFARAIEAKLRSKNT